MENKTLKEFSEITASKEPVPGGGGVSAAVGALAASLAEMVTSLTSGKKKYAEYENEIQLIKKTGDDLRIRLLESINKDAEAFNPLSKAYSMDKENPSYEETMEKCLKEAAQSPFEILELCTAVIKLDERLAEIGSKLAISDAATSAMLAYGALYGALVNVRVNTRLMKDKEYADDLDFKAAMLVNEYAPRAMECFNSIMEKLNG